MNFFTIRIRANALSTSSCATVIALFRFESILGGPTYVQPVYVAKRVRKMLVE